VISLPPEQKAEVISVAAINDPMFIKTLISAQNNQKP
jgi:hypothetical protein